MFHRQVYFAVFVQMYIFFAIIPNIKYYFSFPLLLTPPSGGFYIECAFSNGTLFVFIYWFFNLSQITEIVI